MIRNTTTHWGSVAKFFHWIIALFVLTLLGVGVWMTGLPNEPFKFQIYGLHKAFGVTILALVLLRILWRLTSKIPSLPAGMPGWQKKLAHGVHFLLYACLLIMPISGYVMSMAGGYGVSYFGLYNLPDLIGKDPALGKLASGVHEYTAWVLAGLIGLHVVGGLYHHFIRRDNVLRRMWPGNRSS